MLWLLGTFASISAQTQSPNNNTNAVGTSNEQQLISPNVARNDRTNVHKFLQPNGNKLSASRRSHSYSSGLSSISSKENEEETEFQPLSLQKSIDVLPIPPTAPNK